jgi:anaerobic selenocysteine-containing dehydrogenase
MLLPEPMTPEPDDRQIRGACPLDCPDTCSWIVTVKNGEAVALRGDLAHPYARGSLCNKVENYLTYARSSDRVLYPMLRTGPKGIGEFTRISWDQALERIAAGLGDAIAKHGAEAIWPYAGTVTWSVRDLANTLKIVRPDADHVITLLAAQGYVQQASGTDGWMRWRKM